MQLSPFAATAFGIGFCVEILCCGVDITS